MQPTTRSSYTALDFDEWEQASQLSITPKFQRRSVWTPATKSYFLDTIIQGYPSPPLYLRVKPSDDGKKTIREVVDGQQRIRAVLDFIRGHYRLSKTLEGSYAGKQFDSLSKSEQNAIRTYSFGCELFHGASDADILSVFARLNTYSIALNKQELRNGRFFGVFRQVCYRLAHQYVDYWRSMNVFAERQIARMIEVEFVSELLVAQQMGMQDKKASLEKYYKEWDDAMPRKETAENRFRSVIKEIDSALGERLAELPFHRPALFYSLYCSVYHRLYGLPKCDIATPASGKLTADDRKKLSAGVETLSEVIEVATRKDARITSPGMEAFVTASQRQTDNLKPRQVRLASIYKECFR